MKLELVSDGYERLEAGIQEIENLAFDGVFTDKDMAKRFQQITAETKKLRQTLREVLVINPHAQAEGSDAA